MSDTKSIGKYDIVAEPFAVAKVVLDGSLTIADDEQNLLDSISLEDGEEVFQNGSSSHRQHVLRS